MYVYVLSSSSDTHKTSHSSSNISSLPVIPKGLSNCSTDPVCADVVLEPGVECDSNFVCGDRRLGPVKLELKTAILRSIFNGYERFKSISPSAYLKRFWNYVKSRWDYPDHRGFAVTRKDGEDVPITAEVILPVGSQVDRFGSPRGSYLAPAGTPFGLRAIPMQNLNRDQGNPRAPPYNYYLYEVVKELRVLMGPIAPHFDMPGYGLQYFTNITTDRWTTVETLVKEEYLKDITMLQVFVE
jgi:hypothetical protein